MRLQKNRLRLFAFAPTKNALRKSRRSNFLDLENGTAVMPEALRKAFEIGHRLT